MLNGRQRSELLSDEGFMPWKELFEQRARSSGQVEAVGASFTTALDEFPLRIVSAPWELRLARVEPVVDAGWLEWTPLEAPTEPTRR